MINKRIKCRFPLLALLLLAASPVAYAHTYYGNTTTLASTNATGAFRFALSGLAPNTTYHYRAKAVGNGTSYGDDKSLVTAPAGVDAPIFLDPPTTTSIGTGQIFNLTIKTSVPSSQPVSGVQAFINFDCNYLEVVDADNTTPGIQVVLGATLPVVLQNSADNARGTIDYAAGQQLGSPPPTGTFTVATIRFRALAATSPTTAVIFSFAGTRRTMVDYGGTVLPGTHGDATVQIISGATVDISVTLQGNARPDSGWVVPVTVKFFSPGANVLTAAPVRELYLTTTKSGGSGVCHATGVKPGIYDVTIVSEHTLLNVKRNVTISAPNTLLVLGTLLEGDANNDHAVNISDVGMLAVAYNKLAGQPGYDARVDFDRNGIVNIADFGLLAVNLTRTSPVEVTP